MFYVRNIVGKKVKQARLHHSQSITQEELAARLQVDGWDINRVGVAKIENGLREVKDYELIKLSKALNVTTSWLLGEE